MVTNSAHYQLTLPVHSAAFSFNALYSSCKWVVQNISILVLWWFYTKKTTQANASLYGAPNSNWNTGDVSSNSQKNDEHNDGNDYHIDDEYRYNEDDENNQQNEEHNDDYDHHNDNEFLFNFIFIVL